MTTKLNPMCKIDGVSFIWDLIIHSKSVWFVIVHSTNGKYGKLAYNNSKQPSLRIFAWLFPRYSSTCVYNVIFIGPCPALGFRHIECLFFFPHLPFISSSFSSRCLPSTVSLSSEHDNKHVMETLVDEPEPLHKFQACKPLYQNHITDNKKGNRRRRVRHMTCIRMGMFPIMREEECAKWKAGCCESERVILKGNVGVKGKVIPCMLSLIKYVAQRKCALFYSLARPPLAANQVVHISLHIQVNLPKCATWPLRKVIL